MRQKHANHDPEQTSEKIQKSELLCEINVSITQRNKKYFVCFIKKENGITLNVNTFNLEQLDGKSDISKKFGFSVTRRKDGFQLKHISYYGEIIIRFTGEVTLDSWYKNTKFNKWPALSFSGGENTKLKLTGEINANLSLNFQNIRAAKLKANIDYFDIVGSNKKCHLYIDSESVITIKKQFFGDLSEVICYGKFNILNAECITNIDRFTLYGRFHGKSTSENPMSFVFGKFDNKGEFIAINFIMRVKELFSNNNVFLGKGTGRLIFDFEAINNNFMWIDGKLLIEHNDNLCIASDEKAAKTKFVNNMFLGISNELDFAHYVLENHRVIVSKHLNIHDNALLDNFGSFLTLENSNLQKTNLMNHPGGIIYVGGSFVDGIIYKNNGDVLHLKDTKLHNYSIIWAQIMNFAGKELISAKHNTQDNRINDGQGSKTLLEVIQNSLNQLLKYKHPELKIQTFSCKGYDALAYRQIGEYIRELQNHFKNKELFELTDKHSSIATIKVKPNLPQITVETNLSADVTDCLENEGAINAMQTSLTGGTLKNVGYILAKKIKVAFQNIEQQGFMGTKDGVARTMELLLEITKDGLMVPERASVLLKEFLIILHECKLLSADSINNILLNFEDNEIDSENIECLTTAITKILDEDVLKIGNAGQAVGEVEVTDNNILLYANKLLQKGIISAAQVYIDKNNTLEQTNDVQHDYSGLVAAQEATVKGIKVSIEKDAAIITKQQLEMKTQQTNIKGDCISLGQLKVVAEKLLELVDNGKLKSRTALEIIAEKFNNAGEVLGDNAVSIDVASFINNVNGKVIANKLLELLIRDELENLAELKAEDITLQSNSANTKITNGAVISAKSVMRCLRLKLLENHGLLQAAKIELTGDELTNSEHGTISAINDLKIEFLVCKQNGLLQTAGGVLHGINLLIEFFEKSNVQPKRIYDMLCLIAKNLKNTLVEFKDIEQRILDLEGKYESLSKRIAVLHTFIREKFNNMGHEELQTELPTQICLKIGNLLQEGIIATAGN